MRVVIADHHTTARWALRMRLQEESVIELVGEAEDTESALVLSRQENAEMVLVDSDLPGAFVGDLIAMLHSLAPRPIVVVMSSHVGYTGMLLKAGADAFVNKGDNPELLVKLLLRYATSYSE